MAQTDQTEAAKIKNEKNVDNCLTSRIRKKIPTFFKQADVDGDGSLDFAECYAMVMRLYLEIAMYVALYTVPTRENVKEIFDETDEDKSKAIDQKEFESMVVVLSQNITVRVIAQLLIQFALAPVLATVLLHGLIKELLPFAGLYNVASGYIPEILLTYVFNEALAIIMLAALVKMVVVPRVDSYLGHLACDMAVASEIKVKSTSAKAKEAKEDTTILNEAAKSEINGCNVLHRLLKSKLGELFKQADVDGEGSLDFVECYAMVMRLYLEIAMYVSLYTVPTRENVKEIFDEMDEDGSETIDQKEFESMVVVLSQNITVRVIAQWLIQFVLAPMLATVLVGYIPESLMFNEALIIIGLAALVKMVVIPPVDSYLGRVTQGKKAADRRKKQ